MKNSRYAIRKGREWHEYKFRQVLGSLNASKKDVNAAHSAHTTVKEWMKAKIDCLVREIPTRILGNCCVILCGESNGVKYSSKRRKVHDPYGVRNAIPSTVDVILNPVHDRMTRHEMKLKRCFLSEKGRWVISIWNKGKKFNGKTRDGSDPAWMIFHNGKTKNIEPPDTHLNVDVAVLDISKA